MATTIEKIQNGYLVTNNDGIKNAFPDIETLFNHLLTTLEGKSHLFKNNSYGRVVVETEERDPP